MRSATPTPTPDRRLPWHGCVLAACAALGLAGGIAHLPWLTFVALGLLLAAWLPRLWAARRAGAIALWAGLAVLLGVPAALGHAPLAWMALPVVFPALMAATFGRTLRHGAEPLVARCIRVIEGEARIAEPRVGAYARGVTAYWTCVLSLLACLSLAIALFAAPGGWLDAFGFTSPVRVPARLLAWYPEAGCWLLLTAAFAGEYLFRRWWLRGVPQLNPVRFLGRLAQRWPELLRDATGAP